MTRGGGGVQTPPKKDDIICEQPLISKKYKCYVDEYSKKYTIIQYNIDKGNDAYIMSIFYIVFLFNC